MLGLFLVFVGLVAEGDFGVVEIWKHIADCGRKIIANFFDKKMTAVTPIFLENFWSMLGENNYLYPNIVFLKKNLVVMKKLFLLMLGAGVTAFTANAQQVNTKSLVFDAKTHTAKTPVTPAKKLVKPTLNQASSSTANKTTASPRWYSYFDDVNAYNTGAMDNNLAVMPIWFDTTIRQTFSTGDGTINYSSAALYVDPVGFLLYNDIGLHNGEMQVKATDAYTVDSVRIFAVYEESPSKATSVVDTLYLSIAPSTGIYRLPKADYAWTSSYLATGQDTLFARTPYRVDSVNRTVISDVSGVSEIVWKVPLTDAMRDTGFNIQSFSFKVPGGLNVPAGNGFTIAVTFKSGDTWTPNVDNISDFHRFMPLTGFIGAGQSMPYYWYNFSDRNMSNMMFSTDTSRYLPAVIIEGINTPDYRYEFHNFDAYILCPTCTTVGTPSNSVNNITTALIGNAYPNPATNTIAIPFTVNEAADVKVVVTNATGAVVATQELGKYNANQSGKATFDVAHYANGVYFYTVEANGQRATKRFVVTH